MATIDEDRSLEQLSHLSLVVLSQLHSCDAAQSMCNQRREEREREWQRNCLEKAQFERCQAE